MTADGKMDELFNGGEPVFVAVGDTASQIMMVAVQADGSIVAMAVTLGSADTALIRVRPTGAMDENFGEAGIARVDFGGTDVGNMVSVQGDGKLLLSATSFFADTLPKLTMARFIG